MEVLVFERQKDSLANPNFKEVAFLSLRKRGGIVA
jgi:hypothetical protein